MCMAKSIRFKVYGSKYTVQSIRFKVYGSKYTVKYHFSNYVWIKYTYYI